MENIDNKYILNKIKNEIDLISNNNYDKIIIKNIYLNLIKFLKDKLSLVDKTDIKKINFINNKIQKNIFNYFDCIYIINLPNERYKIINLYNLFKKNKCNFKIINGVIKEKNNLNIFNNWELYKLENKNCLIKIESQLGNLIAHLICLKDMKYNNYKKILILEDDIYIHKNYNNILRNAIDNLKKYDILFLGNLQKKWENINIDNDNNIYKSNIHSKGCFSYSVSHNILNKLINYYEKYNKPVNECLKQIILENNYSYSIYPNIFISDLKNGKIHKERDQNKYYEFYKWNINDYTIQ